MNKTQKCALIVLALSIVLVVFIITTPIAWFNDMPLLRQLPFSLFLLTYLLMGLSIVFLRKKQSPSEVDFDERDMIIKRKATFASYITLWILVLTACTIPFAITDQRGTIPVSILPIVLFLMFIIVMLVYSLAILIQYGWKEKKNE